MKKPKKINKKPTNVDMWAELNKKFDFGRGATYAVTTLKSKDSKELTVDSFYSNKVPKLIINNREIEVEYSSTEQEDKDLLHFLVKKVK